MAPDLKACLQDVLENYPESLLAHRVPRKDLPICQSLVQIAGILQEACQSKGFNTLRVKASWGLGRWNPTPWVAFLDTRVTTTTQRSFYPVFLFRADGSGVYLTLDLGTGRAKGKPTKAEMASLQARATQLSRYFVSLQPKGFDSVPPVDLRREQGVGIGFAAASIVHKFYPRETIPNSTILISDVEVLIKEYERFCSSQELMELFDLIRKGEIDPVLAVVDEIVQPRTKRQGFLKDSSLRGIIEQYAMQRAAEHFQQRGYRVKDVHAHEPYDLHCLRGEEALMVEVKGTTSDGSAVVLTRGEVEHAKIHVSEATLFVCSDIDLSLDRQGKLVAGRGRVTILRPWPVYDSLLSPIGYFYHVPNGHTVKLVGTES